MYPYILLCFLKWGSYPINVYCYVVRTIAGQECTDTVIVGSLSHDNNIVTQGQTYILAGYTIPCSGTVVAWEFCYQILGVPSVTFYPGIWRINDTSGGNTDYALAQSNTVTYDQSVGDPQDPTNQFHCQMLNLSDTDQFTAPAGSVVGLYSNTGAQLLRTNTNRSIATHRFDQNQSSVRATGSSRDVDYNIAIRVHLGKYGNCLLKNRCSIRYLTHLHSSVSYMRCFDS